MLVPAFGPAVSWRHEGRVKQTLRHCQWTSDPEPSEFGCCSALSTGVVRQDHGQTSSDKAIYALAWRRGWGSCNLHCTLPLNHPWHLGWRLIWNSLGPTRSTLLLGSVQMSHSYTMQFKIAMVKAAVLQVIISSLLQQPPSPPSLPLRFL